jgi:chemotaxis protein CheD
MVKTIYMGQMETANSPDAIKTTLGSCIAIILFDPESHLYGVSHAMLPDSQGAKHEPGKYVDTAIPALILKMGVLLKQASRMKAKITGGANMFPHMQRQDNLKIGQRNAQAAIDTLSKLGITLIGKDLGGHHGRELTVETKTGKVWIKSIGLQPKEL